jgi:hypothetical protein
VGVLAVTAALWLLAGPAAAAVQPGKAEVKRVTGKVEMMPKGQTQWVPVQVGARLGAGDDIRAHAGGAAELALPDGSTVLLAENSRFVVNQLEFDAANQTRTALFHLVAGKMRAIVSKSATQLVRTRQSNFTISTPAAVAAARGTDFEVSYDAAQKTMRMAVLKEDNEDDGARPGKL